MRTHHSKLVMSNAVARIAEALEPKSTIVLAEDDGEMRRLLAETLLDEGYDVCETGSGLALFDELRRRRRGNDIPDLIVSDIRMPGHNGLELLRIVRSWGWTVPFVLITSFGDDETIQAANELGATCILSKPFDVDDLCAMAKLLTDHSPSLGESGEELGRAV